ncbi:hypothetical protein GpartN1_g4192.t1 [Galdieria partita]|uniref:PAP/OAS1 substrate-binding-related domain-containing protein n=1 Tax=Galdieria partita TaxID=83374 RepID=A0A9C7UR43_9RHOD|nr:hypothetical protein GpartN1_g4192.t1 [Galdieria partita]
MELNGLSTECRSTTLPGGIDVKRVTKENVSESLDDLFSCIQRSTFITVKVVHSCNSRSTSSAENEVVLDSESHLDASSVTSVNSTDSGWKQSYGIDVCGLRNTDTETEENKSKEEYKRLRPIVSNESILEVLISSFRRKPPKEYIPEEREMANNSSEVSQSFPFSLFRDAQYSVRVFRFLFLRNGNFTISSDLSDWLCNRGDLSEYFESGIKYSVPQCTEQVHTPGDSLKGNNLFGPLRKSNFVFRPGWSEILPPTVASGEGALLLRFIAESRVPLVVFDGLVDLMALYHAFHAPLPKRLDSFLAQLSLLLPRVYDIRCLIEECLEMDGSNMDKVYQTLYEPMYIQELWKKLSKSSKFPVQRDYSGNVALNIVEEKKKWQSNDISNSHRSMETLEVQNGDYWEDEHDAKLLEQRIDALLEDNVGSPTTSTHGGTLFHPFPSYEVCQEEEKANEKKEEDRISAISLERKNLFQQQLFNLSKNNASSRATRKWHSVHGGCMFQDPSKSFDMDLHQVAEESEKKVNEYSNSSDPYLKAFEIGSIFATFVELFGWSQIVSNFERKIYQSLNQPWLVLPAGFAPLLQPDLCLPSSDNILKENHSSFHSNSRFQNTTKSMSELASDDGFSSWYTSSASIQSTPDNSFQFQQPLSVQQSSLPKSKSAQSIVPNLHMGADNIRSEYLSRLGLFSSSPRAERTEDAICVRVNRFLDVCVPTSFSELRREAVFRVVASIIKRSIGAQAFCYGSFATKTYHADSILEIGAFLVGKNDTAAEWSAKLMAALCEDATLASEHSSSSLEFSYLSLIQQEHPVPLPVRNISYFRPKPTPSGCQPPPAVTFTVNWPIEDPRSGLVALDTNSTERDIAPNVRVSVTLNHVAGIHTACVLEEFDHAMGRNHLFKRSLLLVRTWVDYGVKLTDTLPSRAVEVLVVFIANCFHASIETPFDLLYRFLTYFANFDWRNFGLCETGIIDLTRGQRKQPRPSENYLFPPNAEVLLYRRTTTAVNETENNDATEEQFEVVPLEALNIFDHVSWTHYRNICVDSTEKDIVAFQKAVNKGLRDAELFRSAPTAANLQALTGSAWKRHIDRWKLIDTQLALLIDRSLSAPVTSHKVGKYSHHVDDTRPLVYISSAGFLDYFRERDPLYVDMTTLRNNLEYVRFIVNSEVTELGLLAFLTQILAENGCLLIGEIGQHLRSTFGKQDWSNILKERFGGLKRFLLKHSELFYVDTDHPLNPHIYLRASINGPLLEKKPQDTSTETKKSKKNKKQHNNNNNNNNLANHGNGMDYLRLHPSVESHHQPSYIQWNPHQATCERQVFNNSPYHSSTLAKDNESVEEREIQDSGVPLYLQPSGTAPYYSVPTEWLTKEPMTSLMEHCDIEKDLNTLNQNLTSSSSFDYGFGPCNSF